MSSICRSKSGAKLAEETLCGYMAFNNIGDRTTPYEPRRLYRLVYRRRLLLNDGVIEGTDVDAKQEERRLITTRASRQRYDVKALWEQSQWEHRSTMSNFEAASFQTLKEYFP